MTEDERLQRRIQKPVKHQEASNFYAKHSILDVCQGPEYASGLFQTLAIHSNEQNKWQVIYHISIKNIYFIR